MYIWILVEKNNNKSIKSFFYFNIRFCNPTECMQERMESELEAKRKEYLRSVGKIQLDTEQVGGFSPNIWRIFWCTEQIYIWNQLKSLNVTKESIIVLPTFLKDIELLFFVKILAMYDKIVAAKERGSIASYRKPLQTHAHINLWTKWFLEMIHTMS